MPALQIALTSPLIIPTKPQGQQGFALDAQREGKIQRWHRITYRIAQAHAEHSPKRSGD
jgi:hypothetical protein